LKVQVNTSAGIWRAIYPDGRYVQGPIENGQTKRADYVCDRNQNCVHIVNTLSSGDGNPVTEIEDEWHRKITITYKVGLCGSFPQTGCTQDEVRAFPFNGSPISSSAADPRQMTTAPLILVDYIHCCGPPCVRWQRRSGATPRR